MICTISTGKITAGEALLQVNPYTPNDSLAPVVMVHGAEGDPNGAYAWLKYPSRTRVPRGCMAARRRVYSPELGGNYTWGNATAQARLDAVYAYLNRPVVLACQSMGGITGLVSAANNRDKVLGVILVIPAVNLQDIYENSSYASDIATAYGGAPGAQYNPMNRFADLSGLPIQCWYGNSDTLCKPAFTEQLLAAVGGQAHAITGGHADATVDAVQESQVAAFLSTLA